MWFTKSSDGFRGWFAVTRSNGLLRIGLQNGDFGVTVIKPDDSSSLSPAVTESIKPGLYRFDVSSAFLTLVGEYGVVVEIDTKTGPSSSPHVQSSFSSVLRVTQEDFDTLAKPGDAMALTSAERVAIVDAVLDEVLTGHFAANSLGEAITIIRGMVQQNYVLDSTVYNSSNLMLSARMRIFSTGSQVDDATDGGLGQGEFASFTVTAEAKPVDDRQVKIYKVKKD